MSRNYSVARDKVVPSAELLFVDPLVRDLDSILHGLRPEVEPILLEADRPATVQMAAALASQRRFAAVHVMAHGAPGRVCFAAGDWSPETVAEEARAFVDIGEALGPDGDLRIWSCRTGDGEAGAALVDGLARATGVQVSAATGLVGACALGGSWKLMGASMPRSPLSEAGMAVYGGVLVAKSWNGGSGNWGDPSKWTPTGVPTTADNATINAPGTYTVTVGGHTYPLGSLTMNNPTATLAGSGQIQTNNMISGTGTVKATGWLTLVGPISGALALEIDGNSHLVLSGVDSAQSVTFTGGGNLAVNESLALTSALGIGTNDGINLTGGTLTVSGGITLAGGSIYGPGSLANTNVTGYGKLPALSGGGAIRASGGTLDITANITAADVTGLQIDNVKPGILRLDGTVAAGDKITFLGAAGILRLADFSNPNTSAAAPKGFGGTIAGLTASTRFAAPTGNYIDLMMLSANNIFSATLNTTTDIVTVKNMAGTSFAIKLAGSYAPGTHLNWTSDGSVGSKLFMVPSLGSNTFTVLISTGTKSDSWTNSASWSAGTPAASPAPGTNLGFTISGNVGLANDSTIVMAPTLRQATGSGTTVWTIADIGTTQFSSSLTLKNQGQIFVNATNNFTAATGSTSNNWTLTGATVSANNLSTVGSQYFENDGALNVIGTAGTGTTKASFQAGNTNLNITGSGLINLYGNAQLTVGANVGVGGQQTITFISANDHTNGVVTEVSALQDAAQIGGFLAGDKLALQNLGGTPTSESVVDGNGYAAVSISVGSQVVDTVTFLGTFTHGAGDFTFAPSASSGGMLTIGATSSAGSTLASASANGKSLWVASSAQSPMSRSRLQDLTNAQFSEITAAGLKLDNQVAHLVTAMAIFSSDKPSFNPTAPGAVMPNDPTLQSVLAVACHH
jgi:hypothetical protein